MPANIRMDDYAKLRVLLLLVEFPTWHQARHLSYSAQLSIEEGLQAQGVQYLTITTRWFSRAQEICAGKHFDQVWVEILHNGIEGVLDEAFLQWLVSLAPVRIGLMAESLEYYPEEYLIWREAEGLKQRVVERLKYLTHVVACDEKDVDEINALKLVPAIWWPQAVPERFVCKQVPTTSTNYAVFCGERYGARMNLLSHPDLKGLLVHVPSPERGTIYPALYNALHIPFRGPFKGQVPGKEELLSAYLYGLRRLRHRCFARWLEALRTGCAVVNLPHIVKAYAGRVIEGMAAGRPVISWEVPDRPQNSALFEDDREILLYSRNDPSQLAAHIRRILSEPEFGRRIATNALRKLRHVHTMEKRVRQILDWVVAGKTPQYV